MPIRIQRKRTKGWRLPENTVCVSRPSKWGNPFIVDEHSTITNRQIAAESFRALLRNQGSRSPTVEDVKRELRGKNLACWCPLTYPDGRYCPCHADVLLEIANEEGNNG
jgi:hypothetical protein